MSYTARFLIPGSKKHGGNYEKLFEKHGTANYGNDRL